MSLANAIHKHNIPAGIDGILAVLDEEDRDDLLTALNDPSVGHTAIVRGLKTHNNLSISEGGVRRWRERNVESVTLEEAA